MCRFDVNQQYKSADLATYPVCKAAQLRTPSSSHLQHAHDQAGERLQGGHASEGSGIEIRASATVVSHGP
jgi:hypothetical protein